jgi:multidrug efflux pump
MSRFFIDRPIFATVVSILIVLAGIVSMLTLPIARFPEITPPTVNITASYPGASAETVAEAVAAPIEQELSGAKDLLYFQSYSANNGGLNITATFEVGTDIDQAAVDIQNRVKIAEPRLPQEVVRQGVTIKKASTALLMVVALKSSDPTHDSLFLNGYATINMLDAIRRVPGVGDASVFGARDYSMRLWLNPDKLAGKGLTVSDVAQATREQNGLYAAGRIGAEPSGAVDLTVPVITRGRLQQEDDFEKIVLRAHPDGSRILLKDVGDAELGSLSYDLFGRQDAETTTLILTYLQSDGNALETTAGILDTLKTLEKSFPTGMRYEIPYDTTPFIRVAIKDVAKTFAEAIFLVALVVIVFLGTWRATMIPLVAVPVAIIGAFTGMLVLGFSINSLTLFGLVLAIGIVVDDAIIVVENVERIMREEPRLSIRDATVKAMEQVTGPIVAIVLVLSAVFLPVAFLGGLTGEMYQQFAVTIAISVMISGIVALTLSPALCAILLKRGKKFILFRAFDAAFDWFARFYAGIIRLTIRLGFLTILVFFAMLWGTWHLFQKTPGGFIPQEDQGYFIVAVILPPGASLERTNKVMSEVEQFLIAQPEARSVVTLGGIDFLSGRVSSTSAGIMFCSLKTWDERRDPSQSVDALIGRVFGRFGGMKEAIVFPLNPPPVQGLGIRAGFEYQLQNSGGGTLEELAEVSKTLTEAAEARPEIMGVNGSFNIGTPQIFVHLDHARAKVRGLDIGEVYETLQAFLGSLYVNDFIKFGRIYRVQLQAAQEFRSSPEMIRSFYARNSRGEMVPLSDIVKIGFQAGPNVVSRFNAYPAVQITGAPAPGFSTGDTIRAMEEVSRDVLPAGYSFAWSGASYQEIKAGGQAPYIIALGLLVVFLVLAAQYERWSLPMAVLLGIPSGAFGAILAIYLRGLSKDIYFQIGLLTLIGLAAKNAILIVEFSSTLREQGRGLVEAAVEAARVRLRPFIMTSMAFVLGVLPLALAEGAGAAGRHSIGTGVMGGMLAATFLDMFFIPLFFVIAQGLGERLSRKKPEAVETSLAEAEDAIVMPELAAPDANGHGAPKERQGRLVAKEAIS